MMNKIRKFFASAFIVMVLMMMIKPHLPKDNKFLKTIYWPINKVEGSIGTNQTWLMFSPNPSKIDAYVIGEVTYSDGSKDAFDFYHGLDLNIFQKYLYGEKYRKFTSEHLRIDKRKFLWNDGAKFAVAKLQERNVGKKPVEVTLRRFWSETPKWEKHFIKHGESKPKYNSYLYYRKKDL
ncbi:MAG TPA: hypothetical protein VKZ84_07220 [Bacteriovoracaceae bacterium]|nr:hypothetical protein [Bacteriovoracaceae bacterium]